MLCLYDLVGIEAEKRNAVKTTLDSLLTFNVRGKLRPLITGYSWFDKLATSDRVVTFSHSHETEAYKQAMLADLADEGFTNSMDRIRDKGSAYLWDPKFSHRDEHGRLLPGKVVRDVQTGRRIDLKKYKRKLVRYPTFKGAFGRLVCEDRLEWQIDLPFKNKSELLRFAAVFVKGAYGQSNWPAPHELPMLVIGSSASRYLNEPVIRARFTTAVLYYLAENGNEINFIINKSQTRLKTNHRNNLLENLGFKSQVCLVNKPFRDYIDKFEQ